MPNLLVGRGCDRKKVDVDMHVAVLHSNSGRSRKTHTQLLDAHEWRRCSHIDVEFKKNRYAQCGPMNGARGDQRWWIFKPAQFRIE